MQLMISVLSAGEAQEAIRGGADLLDVKNPAEGSLGAQPPRVIREIKNVCPESVEISVAIGDMPNLPGTAALAALGAAGCGIDYIKVGLYGIRTTSEALELLREVKDAVREFEVSVIAAAYADFQHIGALNPSHLPGLAASAGIRGCLIDTAVKDGHRLFDFLSPESVHSLAKEAHEAGLLFACAGALQEQDLPILRDMGVDIAGLRTAICLNNQRTGPLEAWRVRSLTEKFQS